MDWQPYALAGIPALGVTLAAYFAPFFSRLGTRDQVQLTRAQMIQAAEDKFQQQVYEKLDKSEAKIEQLSERINEQAKEIALLTGKVQVLEYSEGALKVENARLLTENTQLRKRNDELDDENILQAQRIAELTGRLAGSGSAP